MQLSGSDEMAYVVLYKCPYYYYYFGTFLSVLNEMNGTI